MSKYDITEVNVILVVWFKEIALKEWCCYLTMIFFKLQVKYETKFYAFWYFSKTLCMCCVNKNVSSYLALKNQITNSFWIGTFEQSS